MFERFTDKARPRRDLAGDQGHRAGLGQVRPVLHAARADRRRRAGRPGPGRSGRGHRLGRTGAWDSHSRPAAPPPGPSRPARMPRRWPRSASTWRRSGARFEESFGPDAVARVPAPPRPAGPDRADVATRESKQSLGLDDQGGPGAAPQLHRHRAPAARPARCGRAQPARGDFTPATLRELGIDPDRARQQVLDELGRPRRNRGRPGPAGYFLRR